MELCSADASQAKLNSWAAVATQRLLMVGRWALGVLFIWSGLAKIDRPYQLLEAIYGYELLTPVFAVALAVVLPWLEALLGVCLLFNRHITASLVAVSAMLAVFSVAQLSALYRNLEIGCGCFGVGQERPVTYASVFLTLSLLGLIGLGVLMASWDKRRQRSALACR